MTFGLMLIPLAAMIGLAVDFGRVYAVNATTQGALDAAALAAGRVAQVETSNVIDKASAAATAYFDQGQAEERGQLGPAVLAQLHGYRIHGHRDDLGADPVPRRARFHHQEAIPVRGANRMPG